MKLSSKKVLSANYFYASLLPDTGARSSLESLAGLVLNSQIISNASAYGNLNTYKNLTYGEHSQFW
ncbi:MAG: hypothetical protein Q8R42_02000, partial [Desulfocapsaceae bacterium]|nr:hypothetical protein [Desulfocapsaceae bacterium]